MLYGILLAQGLALGLIYGLIGLGFSLVFRTAGLLNFALKDLVMIGAMVGYTVLSATQASFIQGMLVVMLAVGLLTALAERLVFLRVRLRGGGIVNAVIASIGLLMILNQSAILVWGAEPLSYPERFAGGIIQLGSIILPSQSVWIAVLGLGVMIALQLFLRYTTPGIALRAVADDRLMSELVGVNANRATLYTFLISGALAGASGMLLGPLYYASYTLGLIGIKGFAAAILGGLGSLPGAVLGGTLLGLAESFGTVYISSAYREVVAYGVMIAVLLLRPQGILGTKERVDT